MLFQPDEYAHNNPNNAFTDSGMVRGGGRVTADLNTLLTDFVGKTDQMKEKVTLVWVESEESYYQLRSIANIGTLATGWKKFKTGSSLMKWVASTAYKSGDVVVSAKSISIALRDIANSGNTVPATSNADWDVWLNIDTASVGAHTHSVIDINNFGEEVQDVVGGMFVAGSNITITYDDATGKITVTGQPGFTQADVRATTFPSLTEATATPAAADTLGTLMNKYLKGYNDLQVIKGLVGEQAGDADAFINTVREVLTFLSSMAEGADLATLLGAKVNTADVVNILTQTTAGKVLDARQGKALSDAITTLSNSIAVTITTALTAFKEANNTWNGEQTFTDVVYAQNQFWYQGVPLDEYLSKYALKSTTPAGIYFTTQPASAPTKTAITGGFKYAETAAVISNNGTPVSIPAKEVNVLNAATGMKRKDFVVARYSGGTAGYELVPGPEVANASTVISPSVPVGTIFVRDLSVTDGGSIASPPSADLTQLEARVAANETGKLDKASAAADGDYAPADSDNATGFFATLLTTGRLKLKPALDRLVTAIQDLFPPSYVTLTYGPTMNIDTAGKPVKLYRVVITGDLALVNLLNTVAGKRSVVALHVSTAAVGGFNVSIPAGWDMKGVHTLLVSSTNDLIVYIEWTGTKIICLHN